MLSKIANFFIWLGIGAVTVLGGLFLMFLATWYIWVAIWVIWLLAT